MISEAKINNEWQTIVESALVVFVFIGGMRDEILRVVINVIVGHLWNDLFAIQ